MGSPYSVLVFLVLFWLTWFCSDSNGPVLDPLILPVLLGFLDLGSFLISVPLISMVIFFCSGSVKVLWSLTLELLMLINEKDGQSWFFFLKFLHRGFW